MQTFLPHPDFVASCQVLDDRRLGKQRVETFQILRALTWPSYAWKSHPAVAMWRGFVPALVSYGLASCREWTRRGYADTVADALLAWGRHDVFDLPPWFGLQVLHRSHQSALVRKDPAFYRPLFPAVPPDLPYYWPQPAFPRWPVRRPAGALEAAEALELLGLPSPWPGQDSAAEAVVTGRDVLVTIRPGAGGSTAGLLAGLVVPGRTLVVSPPAGPLSPPVAPPETAPARPRTVAPVTRPTAGTAARRPSAADTKAMQAEHGPSQWVFRRPGAAATGSFGLVVLDPASQLSGWTRPVPAPVLAVVGGADAARRQALTRRLHLRDPLVAGGGWDVPESWLGVARASSGEPRPAVIRRSLQRRPALVVTSDGRAARRLVDQLRHAPDPLRAAVWTPTLPAAAASSAVAAWRGGRLDALIIPTGGLPALGRRRPALLLHADPPSDLESWRALVASVRPAAAILVAGPAASADILALADVQGCLRQALLEPYGELLGSPCGRCSSATCTSLAAPTGGALWSSC